MPPTIAPTAAPAGPAMAAPTAAPVNPPPAVPTLVPIGCEPGSPVIGSGFLCSDWVESTFFSSSMARSFVDSSSLKFRFCAEEWLPFATEAEAQMVSQLRIEQYDQSEW